MAGHPTHSCKRDQIKMRDYMDRRVTSPTCGPPPLCKQVLIVCTWRFTCKFICRYIYMCKFVLKRQDVFLFSPSGSS